MDYFKLNETLVSLFSFSCLLIYLAAIKKSARDNNFVCAYDMRTRNTKLNIFCIQ